MDMHVIAKRVFHVDGHEVECRFSLPEKEGQDFFCRVQTDWPEGTKSKRAWGVDEVQALLMGMMLVHTDLLAARNMDGRVVEWLDGQSLGLPVTPSIKDWDVDNHM